MKIDKQIKKDFVKNIVGNIVEEDEDMINPNIFKPR
jgi:hypothetical protein